jgi:hypothetical protein
MPKPTNKKELLNSAVESYARLLKMVGEMTEKELETPFDFSQDTKKKEAHWRRDKNLRDVLMHLYEWQRLVLVWVKNNKEGKKTKFLREGYTWRTYGAMNVEIWNECQQVPLQEAKEKLDDTHRQMMALIESLDEDELFTKFKYDWVGTAPLWMFMSSVTASHYEWAMKKLKAHKKNVKGK